MNNIKAETVTYEITYGGNTISSKVYYLYNVFTGNVTKIYFSNKESLGGSDDWAKEACAEICSVECGYTKSKGYYCDSDNYKNIKSGVSISKNENGHPTSISYDSSTVGTENGKIVVSGCFTSYYQNQTEENGGSLTFGCYKESDCNKACNNACRYFNVNYINANGINKTGTKAWFCVNNDLMNGVYINKDGKEVPWNSSETKLSKEEVIEESGGSTGTFFDDWSDIPAVFEGISEIANNKITCEDALGSTNNDVTSALDIIQKVFNFIKIGAVVILVIFTMLDFTKAVGGSDDNLIKKASNKLVKRIIITFCIILLPSLINLILKISLVSNGTCSIG